MSHKPSKSTENVLQILDHASAITLEYFRTELVVENKGGDAFDPLTLADKESDSYIRKSLHKLFPNDLLLTEESPDLPETYEGRVWMVDPLDGTKCFVKGTDNFSINIGLVENGIPIFGCVAIPAQGKVYYAEKGVGAFEKVGDDFHPVATSSIHEISKARLITRVPGEDIRPVEEKLNTLPFSDRKAGGGIGDKLCQIVAGLAEANINTNRRVSKWDTAGPQIILEEAGGVVSDFDGNPIDYKSESARLEYSFIASANPILHSVILKELRRLKV
jgi:3'(2'), 5'-bisphosphate nucleotidase